MKLQTSVGKSVWVCTEYTASQSNHTHTSICATKQAESPCAHCWRRLLSVWTPSLSLYRANHSPLQTGLALRGQLKPALFLHFFLNLNIPFTRSDLQPPPSTPPQTPPFTLCQNFFFFFLLLSFFPSPESETPPKLTPLLFVALVCPFSCWTLGPGIRAFWVTWRFVQQRFTVS